MSKVCTRSTAAARACCTHCRHLDLQHADCQVAQEAWQCLQIPMRMHWGATRWGRPAGSRPLAAPVSAHLGASPQEDPLMAQAQAAARQRQLVQPPGHLEELQLRLHIQAGVRPWLLTSSTPSMLTAACGLLPAASPWKQAEGIGACSAVRQLSLPAGKHKRGAYCECKSDGCLGA